jgi:hypothetical protein
MEEQKGQKQDTQTQKKKKKKDVGRSYKIDYKERQDC